MKKAISTLIIFCMLFAISAFSGFADSAVEITFPSVGDTGKIEMNDLADFTVEVSGIQAEEVQLYFDGEYVESVSAAPYKFSIQNEVLGSHDVLAVVKGTDGNYYEAKKAIMVTELMAGTPKTFDFTGYTAGAVPSGMTFGALDGSVPDDRGDENGTCIMWPTNEDPEAPKLNGYIRITTPSGEKDKKRIMHWTMDFMPENGSTLIWRLYSSSQPLYFSYWQNGTLYVQNNDAKSSERVIATFDCPEKQWHTAYFIINWYDAKLSLVLNGVEVLTDVTIPGIPDKTPLPTAMSRAQLTIQKPVDKELRLDNIELSTTMESPHMTGLADERETAPYEEGVAKLMLSASLEADEIDPRIFTMSNEIGAVMASAVEVDEENSILSITPEGGLEPSNSYTVLIPQGTRLADGTALPRALRLQFKTSAKNIDVVSGGITTYGGNAVFKAEIVNNTGNADNFTAYLVVYENGMFKKLISASCELSSGTAELKTAPYAISGGESFKAFVVNSGVQPISNKIYECEAE